MMNTTEGERETEHQILTERLLLRPIREEDIPFLQEVITRPESYCFESDAAESPDEIAAQCRRSIQRAQSLPEEGAIRWAVNRDGVRIGTVTLRCNWEETAEWEIGYTFLSEYWGKGYATEAVRAAVCYAFLHFTIHRLAAFIHADNERSAALAERIGMVREGRMRDVRKIHGEYRDEFVYSILRREVDFT